MRCKWRNAVPLYSASWTATQAAACRPGAAAIWMGMDESARRRPAPALPPCSTPGQSRIRCRPPRQGRRHLAPQCSGQTLRRIRVVDCCTFSRFVAVSTRAALPRVARCGTARSQCAAPCGRTSAVCALRAPTARTAPNLSGCEASAGMPCLWTSRGIAGRRQTMIEYPDLAARWRLALE